MREVRSAQHQEQGRKKPEGRCQQTRSLVVERPAQTIDQVQARRGQQRVDQPGNTGQHAQGQHARPGRWVLAKALPPIVQNKWGPERIRVGRRGDRQAARGHGPGLEEVGHLIFKMG